MVMKESLSVGEQTNPPEYDKGKGGKSYCCKAQESLKLSNCEIISATVYSLSFLCSNALLRIRELMDSLQEEQSFPPKPKKLPGKLGCCL